MGIAYGNDMTFTTLGQAPPATTQVATNISNTAATLNANINPNYLSTTVNFEYGTTSNYGSTVSANLTPIDGHLNTALLANITALNPGTTYHFRVKTINLIGTTYGSDMTFTTNFSTGIDYGGGIICYVDASGQHGLIAAASDQSVSIQWYNGANIPINNTGQTVGTGKSNTTAIINAQGDGNYAAKICDDLSVNSYSDWYLPSKDELNKMYINLKLLGIGNFVAEHYWSSTESTINVNSWYQYFGDGSQRTAGKNYQYRVRAIRSF